MNSAGLTGRSTALATGRAVRLPSFKTVNSITERQAKQINDKFYQLSGKSVVDFNTKAVTRSAAYDTEGEFCSNKLPSGKINWMELSPGERYSDRHARPWFKSGHGNQAGTPGRGLNLGER